MKLRKQWLFLVLILLLGLYFAVITHLHLRVQAFTLLSVTHSQRHDNNSTSTSNVSHNSTSNPRNVFLNHPNHNHKKQMAHGRKPKSRAEQFKLKEERQKQQKQQQQQQSNRRQEQQMIVNGTMYRPSVHYNCTKRNGDTIVLPRMPSFVIVGVQKGGTSALNALLHQHPRILRSPWFEPHFLDQHPLVQNRTHKKQLAAIIKEDDFVRTHARRMGRLDAYHPPTPPLVCDIREAYAHACFDAARINKYPSLLTYEKTPSYILFPHLPAVLQHVAPWAKIIVSLRHPVDRAFSHFKMMVERTPDQVNATFEQVLAKDLALLRQFNYTVPDDEPFAKYPLENLTKTRRNHHAHWKLQNYLYRSMYAEQLKPWLARYTLGRNLLIVSLEQLQAQPQQVLNQVFEFLEIPRHEYSEQQLRKKNYSPHFWLQPDVEPQALATARAVQQLQLRPDTRAYLDRLFQPYQDDLEQLLHDAARTGSTTTTTTTSRHEDWNRLWNMTSL